MSDTDPAPSGVAAGDVGSLGVDAPARGRASRGEVARARRRFEQCRARGLLRAADVAARLGLSRSMISRFQAGTLGLSLPKLRQLEELLRDVTSGRVVLRVPPPKEEPPEQIANAFLHALPHPLAASADAVLKLPLEGSVLEVAERALVLHAMRRCDANTTAAGELLGIGRKSVARPWAALERERAVSTSKEARTLAARTARDQMASDAWESVPAAVRTFVVEVIGAARPRRSQGGAPALAEDVLLGALVRRSHGDLTMTAPRVGWSLFRLQSWVARVRTGAPYGPAAASRKKRPARIDADQETTVPAAARPSAARPHTSPPRRPQRGTASEQFAAIETHLRSQVAALATAFAYGIVELVTRSSLEELSAEL